ncbi:hypothetical protein Ddc_22260 [Ditylenchus destructor]|nr:hypothetical protein Ddc_22260 [Ditylenchus destructor]
MPPQNLRRPKRCYWTKYAGQNALMAAIGIPISYCPFVFMCVEGDVARYDLSVLRWMYIYPALSIAAGAVTIVAYYVKISWGYVIALALNGASLLGWILALGCLIVSWILFPDNFGKDTTTFFLWWLIKVLLWIAAVALFELALALAYVERRRKEARLSDGTSYRLRAQDISTSNRLLVPDTCSSSALNTTQIDSSSPT